MLISQVKEYYSSDFFKDKETSSDLIEKAKQMFVEQVMDVVPLKIREGDRQVTLNAEGFVFDSGTMKKIIFLLENALLSDSGDHIHEVIRLLTEKK